MARRRKISALLLIMLLVILIPAPTTARAADADSSIEGLMPDAAELGYDVSEDEMLEFCP